MNESPRVTLVVGLGNPLRGDDGIGPRLASELARRQLPPGVRVIDGGSGGLDLLRLWDGWPRVVIVDAADVAQEPGRFVRFTPDEVRLLGTDDRFSLHHAGLAEAGPGAGVGDDAAVHRPLWRAAGADRLARGPQSDRRGGAAGAG